MSKKKHKMLLLNPDGPIELIPEETEQARRDRREEDNKAQADWIELVTKVDRPAIGLLVYAAEYSLDDFFEDYLIMSASTITKELFEEYEDLWKKHSEILRKLAITLEDAIWWEILANEPDLLKD